MVTYVHDAAGNITGVTVSERDGLVRRQTVTVGTANRIDRIVYEGAVTLNVSYDKMSRPIKFDTGKVVVGVEYDRLGTVAKMTTATGDKWVPGDHGLGASIPVDARLAVLSRDLPFATQPRYDRITVGRNLGANGRDPMEAGVRRLDNARSLISVAASLFGDDDGVNWFEKPSNTVFQPAEYVSTNCCMPWDGEYCGQGQYGGGGGGGDDCDGVTVIAAPSPDPAPLDTNGLTPGTRAALACLRTAVADNGGTLTVLSAYRPQSYQDHLREVWDKYQTVKEWPDGQCSDVRETSTLSGIVTGLGTGRRQHRATRPEPPSMRVGALSTKAWTSMT